ncbi:MAG: hypothetical protein M3Q44_01065 [bacterium]|nr:hypothetical protein [bacterium]
MDILLNFQPFVFSSSATPGKYVEGLPLTSPIGATLASHGRIFGLFSITYPEVFPIDQIAREVFPYFEELYYKNECLSVHEHLISSLRNTQLYIEKKILEYGSVENIDFSLCVGVVWGSVLYVGRFGGTTGFRLYRDSTFGNLFEVDDSSSSSSVVSFSGFIQPSDTVCIYNNEIDTTLFPVSLLGLKDVESTIVYSKLSQYFNDPFQSRASCCVVGFYLDSDRAPSVESERIVFVDIESGNSSAIPDEGLDTEFIQNELNADSHLKTPVPQRLFSSEASLKGFSSKIIPSFARNNLSYAGKKITASFTKRRVFVLGCMLLLVFVGFILVGRDYENKFREQKQSAALKSELLPKAQENYKQGIYYAELNADRAKNYLVDARAIIAQFDPETLKDPEVQKLIADVDAAYGAVTKTYMLGEIRPYFDLSTVNAEGVGETFSLSSNSLLISDVFHNSVYRVGTDTRSASAIFGPNDLDGLIGAAGTEKIAYGASTKKGIVRTEEQSSQIVRLLEPSGSWGTLSDMQLFGGNIYLLDQTHGQIWKYIPEGNGFGAVRNYISSEVTVDLTDAVSFSVDGNVWIAKKSGDIVKLFSGKQDSFSVTGVDQGLLNARAIFTDPELEYLYILDDINSRIVVVSKKDGNYLSTYSSPVFKNASDVLVDVQSKQLYVLAKQNIFKVELKEAVGVKE